MKRLILAMICLALGACSQVPSPTVSYGQKAGAGSAGIHTVLAGDTVYTVSKEYNLPMRDIVVLNQLSAPYTLTSGFRLRLPPPNEYRVKEDDNLYVVSNLFDVPQSEIVRLNNLVSPYRLKAGQVLRLPTPKEKIAAAAPRVQPASASMGRAPAPAAVEREVLTAPQSAAPEAPATVQPAAAPPRIPDTVPERSANGKFMWPVQGKVISTYGPKADGLHNDGINIKAPRGTPVRATENGTIVYAGNELKGYGNLVIVRHADQYMSAYAHMDKILAKRGENVKAGQSIGTVGSTGGVDSPQLHFEIRKGSKPVDPQRHL